ncbi:MAG: coenzyme F420-0:L-glutamate ligase [Myxococcota bacterium]|nr:coenzyme F420-0:L-glutamate ligase [Myxococcota bacterium]
MNIELDESGLRFRPLRGVGRIEPGDDLAAILDQAAKESGIELRRGVLVVCQKVISKAEGRLVDLCTIEPSDEARRIAEEDEKDPRHVEIVLRETARVVRRGHRVMICETHHGYVCANAGVDLSNAPGDETAILLPVDCDASAKALLNDLEHRGAREIAIVVTDTFGRPWREGLVDMAVGSAGIEPISDHRGESDLAGRELQVTTMATVDQLAAGAGILMVKDSAIPAVFVEGVVPGGRGATRDMLRNPAEDLFR